MICKILCYQYCRRNNFRTLLWVLPSTYILSCTGDKALLCLRFVISVYCFGTRHSDCCVVLCVTVTDHVWSCRTRCRKKWTRQQLQVTEQSGGFVSEVGPTVSWLRRTENSVTVAWNDTYVKLSFSKRSGCRISILIPCKHGNIYSLHIGSVNSVNL